MFFILSVGAVEVCQTETFQASCPDDQVIIMTTAKYGRMRLGRCVQVNTTNENVGPMKVKKRSFIVQATAGSFSFVPTS